MGVAGAFIRQSIRDRISNLDKCTESALEGTNHAFERGRGQMVSPLLRLAQLIRNTLVSACFLVRLLDLRSCFKANSSKMLSPNMSFIRLDAGARSAIKQIWPTIASHLEKAVDAILDATEKLPRLSSVVKQHRDLIKKLEMSHLQALLSGDLDTHYFVSCRKTVEQEAALGFDAHLRSTAGNYVLRAALGALAYEHKFSRATLVKNVSLYLRSSRSTSQTR